MESFDKNVHVNIYGEEYAIRSEDGDAYVREVAEYVDRKMRALAEKVPNRSPARVAVLAALNIADELFAEQRRGQAEKTSVERRAHDIISLLDDTLTKSDE